MPPRPVIIGPADSYRHAAGLLQEHLQWRDRGPKCTAQRVLRVLFYAAAALCSVFAACRRLRAAPGDQAVRNALQALCPEVPGLEAQLNAALAGQLPRALRRRRQRLAIDLTLVPYHGRPHRRVEELYRSPAKSGTTWFQAYASAYVVHSGRRYTVAVMAVEQGSGMRTVLSRLLDVAARAGVRPALLLLDRGFYSVDVIRYLQAARLAFLMPVVIRGRTASHSQGPGGTRVFALRKRSGWARYTLRNAARQQATVDIGIHCRNGRGRRGRRGRQTRVYAYGGIRPRTTQWLYQTYRRRVRYRDPLPPAARSAHPHHHPLARPAPAVRRYRLAAAQCMGVGPLALSGHPAPRGTPTAPRSVALQNAVDGVDPVGRTDLRGQRSARHRAAGVAMWQTWKYWLWVSDRGRAAC